MLDKLYYCKYTIKRILLGRTGNAIFIEDRRDFAFGYLEIG